MIGKTDEMDLILLKERVMEVGDIVQKIEQDQTHPNSAFELEKMAKYFDGLALDERSADGVPNPP